MNDVLNKLQDFMSRSNGTAESTIKQANALEAYSGDFWTDDVKRKYHRLNRKNLHNSCWPQIVNHITSRYTDYPWHIAVNDNDWQEVVSSVENELCTKNAFSSSFSRSVICGAGYIHLRLDNDKPIVEAVNNQTSIFIDPLAIEPDLSDANECALVHFISKREAESKYDVSSNYISLSDCDLWNNGQETVAKITYYCKENDGVHCYIVVGDKITFEATLPFKTIPVLRFAGYEKYNRNGIEYVGVVQKTYDIQLVANIAFSNLMSRMNRNVRSLLAMSTTAMNGDGVREALQKVNRDEGFILPYNMAGGVPSILQEHFNTDDLSAVINTCRTLMEDTLGIKLQGMETSTATEALIQSNNIESSLTELYLHAEKTMHSFARLILDGLQCDLDYVLENGPSACTSNLHERKQIASLIQSTSDENAKQYLVAKYASTLNDKDIGDTLFANLNTEFKVVENRDNKENMIAGLAHEVVESKADMNEAISIAEEMQNENNELKQENEQLTNELENNKAMWELEKQKMQLDAQKQAMDLQLKVNELNAKIAKMEAETEQIKSETISNDIENMKEVY